MKTKSWKREMAAAMFFHLVYLSYVGTEISEKMMGVLVWPYTLFIMAAFGFQSAMKQAGFSFRKEGE